MYLLMNLYFIYIVIMYLSINWWFWLPLLCPICTIVIKYTMTSCPFCSDTLVSRLTNHDFRLCQGAHLCLQKCHSLPLWVPCIFLQSHAAFYVLLAPSVAASPCHWHLCHIASYYALCIPKELFLLASFKILLF